MMTEDRAGQIDKVRKLLRLAESPNEHEASSARQSAEEYMRRYELTEDDVVEDVLEVVEEQPPPPHRSDLLRVVAAGCGCAVIVSRKGAVALRGRPEAARRGRQIYARLAMVGDCSSQMPPGGGPPAEALEAWQACWWMGFTAAVGMRLAPARKANGARAENAFSSADHSTRTGDSTLSEEYPHPRYHRRDELPLSTAAALGVFDRLAERLVYEVPDVAAVLERLRLRAYAAGMDLGVRVALDDLSKGLLR